MKDIKHFERFFKRFGIPYKIKDNVDSSWEGNHPTKGLIIGDIEFHFVPRTGGFEGVYWDWRRNEYIESTNRFERKIYDC